LKDSDEESEELDTLEDPLELDLSALIFESDLLELFEADLLDLFSF